MLNLVFCRSGKIHENNYNIIANCLEEIYDNNLVEQLPYMSEDNG